MGAIHAESTPPCVGGVTTMWKEPIMFMSAIELVVSIAVSEAILWVWRDLRQSWKDMRQARG